MRIKLLDQSQHICLTIDEAKIIKEALDDYVYLCDNCGYGEMSENTEKVINKLDEAIMKAESL